MWQLLLALACADLGGDSGSPFDDIAWIDDTAAADDSGSGGTDADGDGYAAPDDCDDADAGVHPDARETCDGTDEDCDGEIDEDAGGTWYTDQDGDGYGDAGATVRSCEQPEGVADNGADCDDTDASVNPGATEVSNGTDDDCDGEVDEDTEAFSVTATWSSTGLDLAITGGAPGWQLGMAETGAGSVGWFGESCIEGDEPWGYTDYGWDVCHSLDGDGGFVTSVYPDLDDVADGYTLFDESFERLGRITYVLFEDGGDACWTWGDDVDYYADFGCGVP